MLRPAAAARPATIPALREWRAGAGSVRPARLGTDRGAGGRAARRGAPAGGRPRQAPPGALRRAAAARGHRAGARRARPEAGEGGLPARGGRGAAHRGAHRRRRLLRHPQRRPAPAAEALDPGGHGARLAALSRARPDARQRPQVLQPALAARPDPRARVSQAQPAAPALLGRPGLPHREPLASRDRVRPPSHEAPGEEPRGVRRRASHPRDPGDRHAGPHGRRPRRASRPSAGQPREARAHPARRDACRPRAGSRAI